MKTRTKIICNDASAQGLEQMVAYYKRAARIKVLNSALEVLKKLKSEITDPKTQLS